jgi:hypothetical protein
VQPGPIPWVPTERSEIMLKTTVVTLVAVLVVVWIVSAPAAAGSDVHTWIEGILTFFRHMA